MNQTITLRLDLHTAALIRRCLKAHLRHYSDFSVQAEQLRGLVLYLEEEIEARQHNANGPLGTAGWTQA